MPEGDGRGTSFRAGLLRLPWTSCICGAAVSYVSLNPVQAGMVRYAADWAWSSVRAHLAGKDDGLVTVRPVLDRVSCFADLLLEDRDEAFAALRRAESTGRPVGTAEFVTGLERVLGRRIARRAPGPTPAQALTPSS